LSSDPRHDHVTLAWTGASGMPYGLRLLQVLLEKGMGVHLLISDAARVVLGTETDLGLPGRNPEAERFLSDRFAAGDGQLKLLGNTQWTAACASGSGAARRMVVCPCTTGTLGGIAAGTSNNLIERSADVVLKERGRLILVPREMPYSTLHLENMLTLSRMGAVIMPPCPGFYNQPQSVDDLVDFVVARILDHLDVPNDLQPRWGHARHTHKD
jgi:flavin prenyltransferase